MNIDDDNDNDEDDDGVNELQRQWHSAMKVLVDIDLIDEISHEEKGLRARRSTL